MTKRVRIALRDADNMERRYWARVDEVRPEGILASIPRKRGEYTLVGRPYDTPLHPMFPIRIPTWRCREGNPVSLEEPSTNGHPGVEMTDSKLYGYTHTVMVRRWLMDIKTTKLYQIGILVAAAASVIAVLLIYATLDTVADNSLILSRQLSEANANLETLRAEVDGIKASMGISGRP